MTIKETIKSWRWRVVRAGHTAASFCEIIKVSKTGFSQYLSGATDPSIKMFNKIENKLLELEKEKGLNNVES